MTGLINGTAITTPRPVPRKIMWVEQRKDQLPESCQNAWHAVTRIDGQLVALVAIMQLMEADKFMLVFHKVGDQKSTVEQHPSWQLARDRAGTLLSTVQLVPRAC
jgi:hypothetical protein